MSRKIADLGFSPEEYEAVSALVDHENSLRPFMPVIISGYGQEKHSEQHVFSAILDDYDVVDTSLTLSSAVSRNSSQDDVVGDDDEEVVDTTLSLFSSNSSQPIYNPMPLRCFHPMMVPQVNEDSFTLLSLSPPTPPPPLKRSAKRKRRDGVCNNKRVKRSNNNNGDVEDRRRRPSIDEFPGLVKTLEWVNGSRPVFLYEKKLEGADVRGDQNRLFVTEREPLMEFLTEEEEAVVESSREGLVILGVDESGKEYKLGLKKWRSLNMVVINFEWNKMVAANNAEKGHLVQVWGFRYTAAAKLAFAFIFT